MRSKLFSLLKWVVGLFVLAVLGLLAIRAYDAQRGPPLSRWHTYTPHDLTAKKIRKIEWPEYLKAENELFDEVRAKVTEKLEPEYAWRSPGHRP